jgi:diadenosine tetraphosphate (Ap4A) HIT family hydrolase
LLGWRPLADLVAPYRDVAEVFNCSDERLISLVAEAASLERAVELMRQGQPR